MRLDDNEGLPKWFVPLAALGVLWGLASTVFCYLSVSSTIEQIMSDVSLPNSMDENSSEIVINIGQRAAFEVARPIWAKAAYVIAALCGLAGAIGLLLKKKWSFPVLGIALIGVFIVQINTWMRGGFEALSDGALLISSKDMFVAVATTAITAGLFYMAMQAWEKKWFKA